MSEFQNNHFGDGGDDPLGLFEPKTKQAIKKNFKCEDCLEKFELDTKEKKNCSNCGSENVIQWEL